MKVMHASSNLRSAAVTPIDVLIDLGGRVRGAPAHPFDLAERIVGIDPPQPEPQPPQPAPPQPDPDVPPPHHPPVPGPGPGEPPTPILPDPQPQVPPPINPDPLTPQPGPLN